MRYCSDFADLLFGVYWGSLAMPTKTNGINLQESLMFICIQKNLCSDTAKILHTCYFGNFGACLTPPACRKLWCLFHAKKWYLFLTSFLEYFKDFAKFLIWVLWACPSKAITQRKLWCLSSKQKSNLISYIF